MHRCHFCGKTLPEIPSRCLRCGNVFCSDHFSPENHHCSKRYNQYCENCGRVLTESSYNCDRCGAILCSGCRLPSNHKCPYNKHGGDHKKTRNNILGKIQENITLKNITILSFFLIIFALIIGITASPIFSVNLNPGTQFFNTSANNPQNNHTSQTSSKNYNPTVIPVTNRVTIIPTFQIPATSDSQKYETGATSRILKYVLRGESGSINLNMYSGVYDEISSRPSPAACMRYDYDNSPCNNVELQQYYLKYLDNPIQKKDLDILANSIKLKSSNKDDQVRIAISLVQNIPYDNKGFFSTNSNMISPYAVLYKNKGVCSEKSLLLAYLLRELGYGVILFTFESENHMAVGIKSPIQYSYKNSGYAFIESTTPSIPTDSEGDYVGAGKLTSTPEQYYISDGSSFLSISEEYQDSIAFNQFGNGETLTPEKYRQLEILLWKYGITTGNGITVQENPSDKPLCDGNRLCNGKCWNECNSGAVWTCTPQGAICQY